MSTTSVCTRLHSLRKISLKAKSVKNTCVGGPWVYSGYDRTCIRCSSNELYFFEKGAKGLNEAFSQQTLWLVIGVINNLWLINSGSVFFM